MWIFPAEAVFHINYEYLMFIDWEPTNGCGNAVSLQELLFQCTSFASLARQQLPASGFLRWLPEAAYPVVFISKNKCIGTRTIKDAELGRYKNNGFGLTKWYTNEGWWYKGAACNNKRKWSGTHLHTETTKLVSIHEAGCILIMTAIFVHQQRGRYQHHWINPFVTNKWHMKNVEIDSRGELPIFQ